MIYSSQIFADPLSRVSNLNRTKADLKNLLIHYQRGMILHGLPGNGKTISIKALMRSLACHPEPLPTLYVKSLGKDCDHDTQYIREGEGDGPMPFGLRRYR